MAARKPAKKAAKRKPAEKFVYSYQQLPLKDQAHVKKPDLAHLPLPKRKPLWQRALPYVVIIVLVLACYFAWNLPQFVPVPVNLSAGANTFPGIEPSSNAFTESKTPQKNIEIDSIDSNSVIIRNSGSAAIDAGEIRVYLGNASITCRSWTAPLSVGSIRSCNFPFSCTPGQQVTVASPGNMVSVTCP
jgi:hypothetical protein